MKWWQPKEPQNTQFVPKMMANGWGTPTVVVQGSGDPVSALQLSTSSQHEQPRVSSNGNQLKMLDNIKIC